MKARIWKDRETGRWLYDVQGFGMRSTGDRADWQGALTEAFGEMRWVGEHKYAWPFRTVYLAMSDPPT